METIAQWWGRMQESLFPRLERCLEEPLTEKQRQLVGVLEVVRIEEHVPRVGQWWGRPRCDRRALARAFVAKAVYNLPTTELLIEALRTDANLRRICGWERADQVPSAATFSRAFEELAKSGLLDRVHEALVREHLGKVLVGHVSRDTTEIEAREKPVPKAPPPADAWAPKGRWRGPKASAGDAPPKARRKRGPAPQGEERQSPPPTRMERQMTQTAEAALAELPTACDRGTKRNAKGYRESWIGYKLHLDVCDAGLPLLAVTTSASLHDSQAAVPMARLTARRVTALYEVMDSSYDAALIVQACRELGQVPIIESNPRGKEKVPFEPATARRYDERTAVERANSRLKDAFGARFVRVRGQVKVHAHLMLGVLALFADQWLKLRFGRAEPPADPAPA